MTKRPRMKLHPFHESAARAHTFVLDGHHVYQQFNCAHCGAKQTMPDANKFYKLGRCEECNGLTNIEADGCNYMLVTGGPLP